MGTTTATSPGISASSLAMGTCMDHCRWLPVAAAQDASGGVAEAPVAVAGWNEDAREHMVAVLDLRLSRETHQLVQSGPSLRPRQLGVLDGRATDLAVAKIDDIIVAVTATSAGSLALLLMHLPPVPGATTADLEFLVDSSNRADDGGPLAVLHHLPQLHRSAAASVDINSTQQRLLSVSGDGSIAIVPLEAMQHALGAPGSAFKAPNGWGGYSQARWVDSSTFATAGVPGGLQVWDQRVRAQPVLRSPSSWGHTGCGALDAQQGPARQLLSLAVHPSRPNLAATGSTGGAVAVWDLRFASAPAAFTGAASSSGRDKAGSGDVWRCMFDPGEPLLSAGVSSAVPPLLYCTSDGALCCAALATSGGGGGGGGAGGQQGQQLVAAAVARGSQGFNSFDVEPSGGQDILVARADERLLLLNRGSDMM